MTPIAVIERQSRASLRWGRRRRFRGKARIVSVGATSDSGIRLPSCTNPHSRNGEGYAPLEKIDGKRVSVKNGRLAVVDEDAVVDVPADGAREDHLLEIATLL